MFEILYVAYKAWRDNPANEYCHGRWIGAECMYRASNPRVVYRPTLILRYMRDVVSV